MIKHIVMWRLAEEAGGRSRDENALLVKQKLESLNGRIPGLLKLEVGMDLSRSSFSYDIALYSEFDSQHSLDEYGSHPEHEAVKKFVASVQIERVLVDYEA